ncbi:hypothetical protein XENOCAPTIV_025236 [Xenoophorus captivus]|uniref:Uncharacterized protein n=1 Tax=Xenoophorus captivus TaxID=1517983 RepID=A0ABV0QP73_9TELE
MIGGQEPPVLHGNHKPHPLSNLTQSDLQVVLSVCVFQVYRYLPGFDWFFLDAISANNIRFASDEKYVHLEPPVSVSCRKEASGRFANLSESFRSSMTHLRTVVRENSAVIICFKTKQNFMTRKMFQVN